MALISAEDLDLTEYSDTLVYRVIERVRYLFCQRFPRRSKPEAGGFGFVVWGGR